MPFCSCCNKYCRDCPGAAAEQHCCRGLLLAADDPAGAREAFDRCRDAWTAVGRPYPAALAAERAALAQAAVEPGAAVLLLAEAAEELAALGATSDESRCRRRLRALGHESANPRGRSGYGARLSPREEQVRDLLADGASNKDLAAALFLSPRTAEHHVASVLRKLGTTRAGLARGEDPGRR
ncbi:helix-turn-helix transcriptional regulator [Kitasatospora nipponensis]